MQNCKITFPSKLRNKYNFPYEGLEKQLVKAAARANRV